ncbi:MAG: membrane protein insertase YidC [Deltaproteobacteria bacterium]|nr:membrane protein insertase YidC [Deltaproteobacteria bacterium]
MEKRALLAVIISLIILVIWQEYFAPRPPETGKEKTMPEKAPAKEELSKGTPLAEKKPETVPVTPTPAPREIKVQPGRDITVETPLYAAVFDTRGARLKSWKVKKYLDKIGEGAKPMDLATEALSGGYPFGLEIAEANFPFSPDSLFQVNVHTLKLGSDKSKGDLLFTWNSPDGLRLTQQMIFYADSYRIDIHLQMANFSSRSLEGRPLLAWAGKIFTTPGSGGMACFPGSGSAGPSVPPFTALIKKDLQEIEINNLKPEKRFSKNVQWGGFQDIYFLAALIPKKSEGTELVLKKVSDTGGDLRMGGPKASLDPGTQFSQSYTMYLGPKDLDILKAFGEDLDRALDFGWFDVVAKPMLYALKFFNHYTGNYGLAIIILTVIIKILFWWPTHISYKSMKEMKKIQPEMTKLREKFKDDREKLNKEVMELYRRYKINPMSGCLPIAIQIPIFFALYKVLLYSIEIRHAPFYWWIQDLSAQDPYYISPILMGVSMFIQQWLTPTTGDPTQAKMMLIMPVIFTFMFLTFPTGLVLYWLFNNLLSIGQQIYINKQAG